MSESSSITKRIVQNGMVAAVYYVITMILVMVPAISQFGPIQVRVSEMLMLLAFFRPDFISGLVIGCFMVNATGAMMGLGFPMDMLFGTLATAIAAVLTSYASPKMFVAALWSVLINGLIVGLEIYFFFNEGTSLSWWLCCAYVAAGEAIAMAIGYAVFMILIRNKGVMNVLAPTHHKEVKF